MDTRLSKLTASNLSWPSVKRVIASSQLSFLCLQQAFTSTSSLLHPSQARPTYPTSCFIGYSPPTLLHLSPSLFSYSLVLSSPQERRLSFCSRPILSPLCSCGYCCLPPPGILSSLHKSSLILLLSPLLFRDPPPLLFKCLIAHTRPCTASHTGEAA